METPISTPEVRSFVKNYIEQAPRSKVISSKDLCSLYLKDSLPSIGKKHLPPTQLQKFNALSRRIGHILADLTTQKNPPIVKIATRKYKVIS